MPAHRWEPTPEQLTQLPELNNTEAARLFGKNPSTIRRYRMENGIPLPGGHVPTPEEEKAAERPPRILPEVRSTLVHGPRAQRETAVLVMSDMHYGKRTASYSPAMFERRMLHVGETLARIRELLSAYHFDELICCIIGDANDGSEIYKTQPHHQAITNVEEQAWNLSDYLAPWLRQQKQIWGDVRVECVAGNHGRASRFAHEAASWDIVAYKYLKLRLAGAVDVNMNEKGSPFLRKLQIRRHQMVLYHGHEIRMYQTIPWYGIFQRLMRWNSGRLAPIDVAIMGHFHSFGDWKINRTRMLASGTMVTEDEWALEALGMESANTWQFFGVSDHYPVTWSYGIELAL